MGWNFLKATLILFRCIFSGLSTLVNLSNARLIISFADNISISVCWSDMFTKWLPIGKIWIQIENRSAFYDFTSMHNVMNRLRSNFLALSRSFSRRVSEVKRGRIRRTIPAFCREPLNIDQSDQFDENIDQWNPINSTLRNHWPIIFFILKIDQSYLFKWNWWPIIFS